MKDKYSGIYNDLIKELKGIEQTKTDELNLAEYSFRCSCIHWLKLNNFIIANDFENEQEEINFFRHIKPQFTGLIEYYTLRHHAIFLRPNTDTEELLFFWRNELKKITRFYETNAWFYSYLKSRYNEMDPQYFLRKNFDDSLVQKRMYTMDKKFTTSYDFILASFAAYEKYMPFVEEQIKILTREN